MIISIDEPGPTRKDCGDKLDSFGNFLLAVAFGGTLFCQIVEISLPFFFSMLPHATKCSGRSLKYFKGQTEQVIGV